MTVGSRHSDPFLERQSEPERASLALRQAAGGEGGMLLVEGPAGIGKTRLLAAVTEMASEADFELHWGRGDDLESGFAYGVLRQLLAPALARLDPAERAVVLEGPASFLASMVEGTVHDGTRGPGDEGLRAAYGLYQLVQDLAASRPRLLCVDDAHWADLPSLHALAFVARRLTELPVLLVFASRRPVKGPVTNVLGRLESVSRSRRLTLSPLAKPPFRRWPERLSTQPWTRASVAVSGGPLVATRFSCASWLPSSLWVNRCGATPTAQTSKGSFLTGSGDPYCGGSPVKVTRP